MKRYESLDDTVRAQLRIDLFVWTATAEQILAKVARGRVALQQVESQ